MKSIAPLSRLTRALAPGIVAVTVAGCVSAHLVHQDPSFTLDALKAGKVAVGGIATSGSAEPPEERQSASAIDYLEREIRSRRPELALEKHATVTSALNKEAHREILNSIGADEALGKAALAQLKAKGVDYLIFLVVAYNSVDRFVTNHTDVRNIYDADNKVTGRKVKYHTVAQTKRSVTAEYRVYETSTGKRLWVSESSNSRSRSRTADADNGYPAAPDYAPAPTLSRVLRSMTTAAVKELLAPQSKLKSRKKEDSEKGAAADSDLPTDTAPPAE